MSALAPQGPCVPNPEPLVQGWLPPFLPTHAAHKDLPDKMKLQCLHLHKSPNFCLINSPEGNKTNHFCWFVPLEGGGGLCRGVLGLGRILFSHCYFEVSGSVCILLLDINRSHPTTHMGQAREQGAGSSPGRASSWERFAEATREPMQSPSATVRKGGSSASNAFPLLSSHPRSYELLIIIFTAQLTIPSHIFCP